MEEDINGFFKMFWAFVCLCSQWMAWTEPFWWENNLEKKLLCNAIECSRKVFPEWWKIMLLFTWNSPIRHNPGCTHAMHVICEAVDRRCLGAHYPGLCFAPTLPPPPLRISTSSHCRDLGHGECSLADLLTEYTSLRNFCLRVISHWLNSTWNLMTIPCSFCTSWDLGISTVAFLCLVMRFWKIKCVVGLYPPG